MSVATRQRAGWLATALFSLAALTSPASAEHVTQSIALSSPDGGLVSVTSFVRDDGRVYLAGGFFGNVDFNPNGEPSLHASTCPTPNGCSFVAKYDETLQLVWVDVFYSTGDAKHQFVAERAGGGVYFLLDFSADFASLPNETEPVYPAAGERDVAIVALDGDGHFAGSTQLGSAYYAELHDARPFEAAPGILDVTWQNRPAPEAGSHALVSRVDMLTGIISAPLIDILPSDVHSWSEIFDQRIDATGRYACGLFLGNVDFDALHAHRLAASPGAASAFVARYDTSGALVWLSIASSEYFAECYALAVAGDGTVWALGDFNLAIEVRSDGSPSTVDLTPWGEWDMFALAFDRDGALLSSAHVGGPDATVWPERVEASADGSLSIVGEFGGTILHGFTGEMTETAVGEYDAFVLVAGPDLTTRYFGHVGYETGGTFARTLGVPGPLQVETVARMGTSPPSDGWLNYALAPEQALLHDDGSGASAYVRYDLDALLVDGFDSRRP